MKSEFDHAAELRKLLVRLKDSRNDSADDQEIVHDEVMAHVRTIPGQEFLEALDEAVGNSQARRRESVYLLVEFTHVPEVLERIALEFASSDSGRRCILAQTVGLKRLTKLAPYLNPIIESDPDIQCRIGAIHSAGTLKSPHNLPILLQLSEDPSEDIVWPLTVALKTYAVPEARGYFEKVFANLKNKKSLRLIAAWGLAKLGDQYAEKFLTDMLDDPDVKTEKSYTPGESMRAAQALCDVKSWPFEWSKIFVEKNREEWKRLLAEDYLKP